MKHYPFLTFLLCCTLLLFGPTASAEIQAREAPGEPSGQKAQLPPDILADKYLRHAEQLVREEDYEGARKALEKLFALQQEHGLEPDPEEHFIYARVWASAGLPERALESAVRYLKLRGRKAEHYEEALDLINRAETGQIRTVGSESTEPSRKKPGTPGETVVFDGIEFVWIPPGSFEMGSAGRHAEKNERPLARVTITRGFYLGKYEVTQAEWQVVMGDNPSYFPECERCPVEMVSWNDVKTFIGNLNRRSGGKRYRLPTEAEWEYAARAGTTTDTYAGDITKRRGKDPVVDRIAWYDRNSKKRTHPVGGKEPNAFGLYDMMGNVLEWVEDGYGKYPGGTVTDPTGPKSKLNRLFRGGSWFHIARDSRSAARIGNMPGARYPALGFRLVRAE